MSVEFAYLFCVSITTNCLCRKLVRGGLYIDSTCFTVESVHFFHHTIASPSRA
jgi:hypothetical protein